MDEKDWVTVHSYINQTRADLAVSVLHGAGIEVVADNEHMAMAGLVGAAGAVHVMVPKEQAEQAAELLAEMDHMPEDDDEEEVEDMIFDDEEE